MRRTTAIALALALGLAAGACSDAKTGQGVTSLVPTDAIATDTGGLAPDPGAADPGATDPGPPPPLCAADQCEIDGQCYADATPHPTNGCQACLVAQSATAWSDDDGASCDDGDLCTLEDLCQAGACQPGEALDCSDGNDCTDDTCEPTKGCANTERTGPCDDESACTEGDQCEAGVCVGVEIDCDDGNDCTNDSCNAKAGCRNNLKSAFACVPTIDVTFPPRAATVLAEGGAPDIVVTGTVTSGAGPIEAFTINGADVAVDPTSGAFSHPFAGQAGGNTLVFFAKDAFGSERDRVQGYHWSTDYRDPDPAIVGDGMVDPGLAIWLDQVTLDDGDHSLPPNDLATIFEQVFVGFDIAAMIPNPVTEQAGYEINLNNLTHGAPVVALTAIDGGLRLVATIPNLKADINGSKTCSCSFGDPLCCAQPGSINGTITIAKITIDANIQLEVNPDHSLNVQLVGTSVVMEGFDVSIDGILGFLTNWLVNFFEGTIADMLEEQFVAAIEDSVGPMLGDALGALAFNLDFDLPRLDGAVDPVTGAELTIPVSLQSDFAYTDFTAADPQGGALGMRARATTPVRGVPAGAPFDDNLGTALRVGCGDGPQVLVVPKAAPFEVVFADDTLNMILHAAWWGGLLDFPVGPDLLGGFDLSGLGVIIHSIDISALLPPLASDCGPDGALRLHAADLMVTADLDFIGTPLIITVYAAFDAPISLAASDGELAVTIESLENVEMEVHVDDETQLEVEPVFEDLLTSQLIGSLEGLLGGGEPLFAFPLPEIDLSDSLGMAPGSLVIAIETLSDPAWAPRIDGNTIVYGQLK